jgi:hypothetical protein
LRLFFLAAAIPFLLSFTFFVVSQRDSLLMDPEEYMALLKERESATHGIERSMWKRALARDPLCRDAESLVIGSSRVREIDATVTGTSTCNLYVEGLAAHGFAHLAGELSPVRPGRRQVVYLGIDHFALWVEVDDFNSLDERLLDKSRQLWRMWAMVRPLRFFSVSDLLEAARRVRQPHRRFEDYSTVYFVDGHVFHPRYYEAKRAGKHRRLEGRDVEANVAALFGGAWVHEANVRALEAGLRTLGMKGYTVRVFWTPVPPTHIASARRHYPVLFQQSVEVVDRLAEGLRIDRYLSASETLDPTRFGCTDQDYFDTTHVDVDCMRRVFNGVFRQAVTGA